MSYVNWVRKFLVTAAVGVGLAQSAQAGYVEYTSEASFLAALSSYTTDSFDDLPLSTQILTPLSRAGYAVDVQTYVGCPHGTDCTSLWTLGSGADRWLSAQEHAGKLVLSGMGGSVNAVGGYFFGTAHYSPILEAGKQVTLTVADADETESFVLTSTGAANGVFRGYIFDDALSSVSLQGITVSTTDPYEGYSYATVNNLSFGAAPVPEPATLLMMALGLAGVGAASRRQRRG